MYFEEYGNRNNSTIVFLHCAGIVEIYLKQYVLSKQFHIIVPHLFGSGKEVETDFNFEQNVKSIIDIIKNLGKEKVYLVGHSEGANIAIYLISHYQELFYKAIISSPMVDKTDQIGWKKSAYVLSVYWLVKSRMVGRFYIKFLNINDEDRKDFFLSYWVKISKNTWRNYYTDRLTFEKCPQLKNVAIPILCVIGSKEPKVIKQTAETIRKLNSNCCIKMIQKAGHEHPVKKADNLRKIIVDFFC